MPIIEPIVPIPLVPSEITMIKEILQGDDQGPSENIKLPSGGCLNEVVQNRIQFLFSFNVVSNQYVLTNFIF